MKTPAARRATLVLVAGIVWSLVGLVLLAVATNWLIQDRSALAIPLLIGVAMGYLVFRFGFSHLARRNLFRIYAQSPHKDKICVFAFQNIRSYLIVIVMMAMGYALRHSGIPKLYLAPIYLAIGIALTLSSLLYYNRLRATN
jgi:hypothetical protein